MTDNIKPALTPEEWADFRVYGEPVILVNADPPYHTIIPEKRHHVAAVCLHGQPFGFTREDVRMLGEAFEMVNQRTMTDIDETWLRSLAARIEALLPPPPKDRT